MSTHTIRTALAGMIFAALASAQEITATVASQPGDYARVLDATPDPDGTVFYFTATGPNGPGVFRVAASGGPVTAVAAGAPFVDPAGISISGDGRLLYVADPYAYAGRARVGQIFTVPVTGGAVEALRGAAGRTPRGVEVAADDSTYFTGRNPVTRKPAVYRLPAGGADSPAVVFEGEPMVNPDSVAVTRGGTVYVTDRGGVNASVCKIERGAISKVVDFIRAGDPAGLALSIDEGTLAVSTLQPYRNRAQVLLVDLATLEPLGTSRGIGDNVGAGGLHRARNAGVFAWAGYTGDGAEGKVYRVTRP